MSTANTYNKKRVDGLVTKYLITNSTLANTKSDLPIISNASYRPHTSGNTLRSHKF